MEVKIGELENCTMKPRKIKVLLHDDVMYQILLWLPVISLFRFKRVCRSWRALIESSYFIRQHLHRHHYDPSLKDKNQSIIYKLSGNSPITFSLNSFERFKEPNVCLELNCSDLHGYYPVEVRNIASFNGIICLNLFKCKREYSICLWNPATKQSRVLPQSPLVDSIPLTIGFGFDIKSNDYKVVKLIKVSGLATQRFEVYSLNTGSWRSLTAAYFRYPFINPRMPFNNGTCFFWGYKVGVLCFDFSSEMFRSISLPRDDWTGHRPVGVVHDKIAYWLDINLFQIEIWVFNEYGTVNESWTKFYKFDTYPIIMSGGMNFESFWMNGNYIFNITMVMDRMYIFNVVTKETNCITLEDTPCSIYETLVGFKESLVSVEEGNNAPICINNDSGMQK